MIRQYEGFLEIQWRADFSACGMQVWVSGLGCSWRVLLMVSRANGRGHQLGPPIQDAEYQENDEHESGNPASRVPAVAKDQGWVFVSRCAKHHRDRDDQWQIIEQVAGRDF